MTRAHRRRRRVIDERGATIMETLVAVSILVTVSVALLGVLDSFMNASRRQDEAAQTRSQVRQALSEIDRDLRSADRFLVVPKHRADREIAFRSASTGTVVRILVDGSGALVRRQSAGPAGPASSRSLLEAVANDPTADDMFQYFDVDGDAHPVSTSPPGRRAECTRRVVVTLSGLTASDNELSPASTSVAPPAVVPRERGC